MKPLFSFCVALLALAFGIRSAAVDATQCPVTDIGSRLELFVDRQLVESTRGVTVELQRPITAEKSLTFDKPWERAFARYGAVYCFTISGCNEDCGTVFLPVSLKPSGHS